jgi:hypothetical protein
MIILQQPALELMSYFDSLLKIQSTPLQTPPKTKQNRKRKEKKRKIEFKSFFRELQYQRNRTVLGEEYACYEKFQWHCQLPALWCMLRNSNLQGKKKLKSGTG